MLDGFDQIKAPKRVTATQAGGIIRCLQALGRVLAHGLEHPKPSPVASHKRVVYERGEGVEHRTVGDCLGGLDGPARGKHGELSEQPPFGAVQQIARILMNLGLVDLYTGDHASAEGRYMEAGAIWDELGDLRGQSVMRQNLATVYGVMGDFERAVPVLEQSLSLARAAGDGMQVAATAVELAKQLLQYQPDDPQIPSLLREGLELVTALGERRHIIECLEVIAAFCARGGAPRIGAELIGAAEAERTRAGAPRLPDERPLYEIAVRELEQALGPEGYDRERKRGQELTRAVAVALALKSVDPSQD